MEKIYPNLKQPQLMWTPSPDRGKKIKEFQTRIEEKYSEKFSNYWELHKWSVDHISEFWAELWNFSGIIYSKKYHKVVDESIPMDKCPKWFEGAELNYAENLLKYRDDRTALIVAGEERETELVTYKQMYNEVTRYAASFRKLGLKSGDIVTCYMSNRKEAIFAMLAVVSIGGIWTGALPNMGSEAVLNRFKQVQPKFMITVDEFSYDRNKIRLLENIRKITEGLPSLEKVIIVSFKESADVKDISKIRNSCLLEDFLRIGSKPDGSIPALSFEQVSFSHPVFISFTSGTTGLPKPLIHGIGIVLNAFKDYALHLDMSRDSVWLTMSPVGWTTWNIFTTLLYTGAGLLLFDGLPYFLTPTFLWDMVDEFKLSHIFLQISIVNELEKRKYIPTKKHDLTSIKAFVAGGSVVKPGTYDFMKNILRENIPFSSGYGSTETSGSPFISEQTLPIYKGEINAVTLGNKLEIVNENGDPVYGEIGEMVFSKPAPNLFLGIWGDKDGCKCKEKYYSKYAGKFLIGDHGIINPLTKGLIVCGRSDDTLKQRGCRFGSADIYNVVEHFIEVLDSLCVSHYKKDLEERAVLFLKIRQGYKFSDNLVQGIRDRICEELTPRHVPDIIIETKDIPYNINGKKMEMLVKNIINNKTCNFDSVFNPDCLKYYENIKQQLNDF